MPSQIQDHTYQIKLTLRHTQPAIWRRVRLPESTSLADLHYIAQVSMGWTNSHLHMFVTSQNQRFGDPAHDEDDLLDLQDERAVTVADVLRQPGHSLTYEYDFGDGWEHEVLLEKVLPGVEDEPVPRCIHAIGQCPPEDIGGVGGFYAFLEAMEDKSHPEHETMVQWLGAADFDPDGVDLEAINEMLQSLDAIKSEDHPGGGLDDFQGLDPEQVHALLYNAFDSPGVVQWHQRDLAAVSPVMCMARVLLTALREKEVKLTAKGNLPMVLVRSMLDTTDPEELSLGWPRMFAGARSEEDVMPVHVTRLLAGLAGLTKTQKGRLSLKKATLRDIDKEAWGKIHLQLLIAAMHSFNWAYLDGFEELRGVQTTAPFTFWLLRQYGHEWRPESDYHAEILQAFPTLVAEASDRPYMSAPKALCNVLSHRMFRLYHWLGLVERREDKTAEHPLAITGPFSVRRTTLFDEMVDFQVQAMV